MTQELRPLRFDTLKSAQESLGRILSVVKQLENTDTENKRTLFDTLQEQLMISCHNGESYLLQEIIDASSEQTSDYRKQSKLLSSIIYELCIRTSQATSANFVNLESLENALKSKDVIDLLKYKENKLFVIPIHICDFLLRDERNILWHVSNALIKTDIVYELTDQDLRERIKDYSSQNPFPCIYDEAFTQLTVLAVSLNSEEIGKYIESAKQAKKCIGNYPRKKQWQVRDLLSNAFIFPLLQYFVLEDVFPKYQGICMGLGLIISIVSYIKACIESNEASDSLEITIIRDPKSLKPTIEQNLDKTIKHLETLKNQDNRESKKTNHSFFNKNNWVEQHFEKNIITQCLQWITPK